MTRRAAGTGDMKDRDREARWAELDALDDHELGLRVEAELDQHDWAIALEAVELPDGPAREVDASQPSPPSRRSRAWLPLAAALILATGLGVHSWREDLPWPTTTDSGAGDSATDNPVVWRDNPALEPGDGSRLGLELASPAPGELRWTRVDGAVGYRLEVLDARGLLVISRDLEAEGPTVVRLEKDDTDLSQVDFSEAVYARVTAKLMDGREHASEIIDFQSW